MGEDKRGQEGNENAEKSRVLGEERVKLNAGDERMQACSFYLNWRDWNSAYF